MVSELFTLYSFLCFLAQGEWTRTALAGVTVLLLLAPRMLERMANRSLRLYAYVICIFYALGSMLGHSYGFYYRFAWWDKLLHLIGGVMFALLGFQIPALIRRTDDNNLWLCALFGLCFSMAVALLWEFFEYGMDTFFDMDMQNDTIIHSIHSYQLGTAPGVEGHIENISEVLIDGRSMGLTGYLDIGLHDTMSDTLIESLGALLAMLCTVLDKARHPILCAETEPKALDPDPRKKDAEKRPN